MKQRNYLPPFSLYLWVTLALALNAVACAPTHTAPQATSPLPNPISDSDLVAAGVPYGADSSQVRAQLGPPGPTSTQRMWEYTGLRIWFQGPAVHQVEIFSPAFDGPRRIRVGADTAQIRRAFGRSCVHGMYAFCRTVGSEPDQRGVSFEVQDGTVTALRVGAVFDLD